MVASVQARIINRNQQALHPHLVCALASNVGRFDDVFDERVDNSQLYEQAVQPLVGTIFRQVGIGARRVP